MTEQHRKYIRITTSIFIPVAIIATLWWMLYGKGYRDKARETQMLTLISSVVAAEQGYYEASGTYSDDFNALGLSPLSDLPENAGVSIYLNSAQVPSEIKVRLSEGDMPFVSKDSYRIVAVLNEKGTVIFVQEKDKPLRRVPPLVE